jgi:hypothetical protein
MAIARRIAGFFSSHCGNSSGLTTVPMILHGIGLRRSRYNMEPPSANPHGNETQDPALAASTSSRFKIVTLL